MGQVRAIPGQLAVMSKGTLAWKGGLWRGQGTPWPAALLTPFPPWDPGPHSPGLPVLPLPSPLSVPAATWRHGAGPGLLSVSSEAEEEGEGLPGAEKPHRQMRDQKRDREM